MPALQQFFDAERLRRGWSMREMAKRSRISLSKAYAITNGDDNVEFETFENIATAFSMSPAELAVAIGKGPASADSKRAPIHAVLRDVPDEQLGTVEVMLRGLAVQPAQRSSTGRRDGASTRRQRTDGKIVNARPVVAGIDDQGGISTVYGRFHASLLNWLGALGRLIAQPARVPALEVG